ncbi:MAG: SPOR domain-containing protein [Lewinellaceae bacterium]|nr:SPOR domain-containing protein [Saprospiraceae bacterium]MCB9337999.1 SPOR domain-containing protein [Lewinellaceae bacterium]
MKNPILFTVLLALFCAANLHAQDKLSWKKHVKLAEQLFEKAQYADAGEHYRAAWKQKTKKQELIYKAGECFYTIRDYRNAVDCWKNVKDENNTYPLIGLRYARSLKQNGEYEAASSELVSFLGKYQGSDKVTVTQIVQNELRGCELAAQLAVNGGDKTATIEHLSSNVNTPETEFAPFPFGDEALYYSSTMGKRAGIYRSLKVGGEWGKSTPIENFPVIENDHFCNGSLSPDASRFYFTICKSVENWGGLTTQCEIYVTRRVGKTWTAPERLPDYVNEAGVSTTHPFVVHDNNTEILYFSSNRNGGNGGMDIWYSTRELNSNANDFTLPINAGSRINTIGDEITPYYNQVEGTLYFASNGQVSIGGFDVFKANGARSRWDKAENVGTPINSSADDFFFIKTTSGKSGFVVSNRTFGMEKITTTNEDIFEVLYNKPSKQWVARGEVYSKSSKEVLPEAEVALYEMDGSGQRRFISKIKTNNGAYEFLVEPSKRYSLEAMIDGYYPSNYEFDTNDYVNFDDFGAPIFLEPYYNTVHDEPVAMKEDTNITGQKVAMKETMPPAAHKNEAPKKEEVLPEPAIAKEEAVKAKPAEPKKVEKTTAAPASTGTVYKIQIIALSSFNPNQSRYSKVKDIARIDTEFITDRKLYRVMLADYNSIEEAQADLDKVKGMKDFSDAFIVEYKDGERVKTY